MEWQRYKLIDGQGFKEGDTIEVTLKNPKGQEVIERFYCDGVLVNHEPTKGVVLAILVSDQIGEDNVKKKYKDIKITGVRVKRKMSREMSVNDNSIQY